MISKKFAHTIEKIYNAVIYFLPFPLKKFIQIFFLKDVSFLIKECV